MKSKPKIAIAGIGRWGKNLVREMSRVTDIATCLYQGDQRTAAWLAEHYPLIPRADSYDDMLANAGIDAVVIATPIPTHYEMTKKALLAGKDVFIEKPIALDVAEAEELVAIAEKEKRVLFAGYIYLWHDVFLRLKEWLKNDKVRHIDFKWEKWGTFGEDICWNLLTHQLSVAFALCGTPKSVVILGSAGALTNKDIITVNAPYTDGSTASFSINRLSEKKEWSVAMTTEKGRYYLWKNDSLWCLNHQEKKLEIAARATSQALTRECEEFVRRINTREKATESGKLAALITATTQSIIGK